MILNDEQLPAAVAAPYRARSRVAQGIGYPPVQQEVLLIPLDELT